MKQSEQLQSAGPIPLHVGDALPPLDVRISAEKMKTAAALLADPNPIHFDAEAVKSLGLGERPINQGPLNMGYLMNMLANFSGSHERLRQFKVRFVANVFAGDHVQATGQVTALHPDAAPNELEVECAVQLTVVGADPVLLGTASVVVPQSRYVAADAPAKKGLNT